MEYKEKYEDKLEKPNGGIVLENFSEGDGFYKVNLAYLSKEQVEEIENIVKKWNPELAKSEDKIIRKQILDCFKTMKQQGCFPSKHKEQYYSWITWLEKQGEQSKEVTYTNEVETGNGNIKALVTEKHKFNTGDWIVSKYGDLFQIKEVIAGGYKLLCPSGNEEINSVRIVDNNSHLWTIQDAKDGDVLHSIGWHNDCIFIFNGLDNWKFDEPNGDRAVATGYCCLSVSADKMEFGIQGPDCIEANTVKPSTKIQRNLLFQKMKEAGYEWDADKKELKKIEQNSTDKIEPKFKVGDWIAHNTTNTTFCIDDISDGRYYITRSNGDKTYNSIKMVEDHAHLWTIKDAKPGDILTSSKSIFIFKGIYMADKPKAYCGVMNGSFIDCPEGCWTNERCYPATREQQKLLFEKITEAGYEWKEKVLNKIKMQDLVTSEDNVTKISDQDKWNNEDIRMLNTVINIFEKVYPSNYFTTFVAGSENPTLINSPEIVKWLKGIKQKALGKLKLTKEDIEALRIAIINLGDMAEVDAINNFNMTFGEAKEKLIEIKDRYTE